MKAKNKLLYWTIVLQTGQMLNNIMYLIHSFRQYILQYGAQPTGTGVFCESFPRNQRQSVFSKM